MTWIWLGLAAFVLLVMGALFFVLNGRRIGPLFSDEHLAEVASAVPALRRTALAQPADEPASLQTSMLVAAYTVTREDTAWVHHISVSNAVTPARAAGTFFLGLLRGLLRLDAYPPFAVFVTQSQVFHLVVHLSDEQQDVFAAIPAVSAEPSKLRDIALAARQDLLPLLAAVEAQPGNPPG